MNDRSITALSRRAAPRLVLMSLIAMAFVGGCECNSANPVGPIVLPPLSAVVVTPGADTVRVGDTVHLTAVALDTLGQPVAGAGFTWKSADPSICSTGLNGLVTGVAEGLDTVYAKTSGGRTGYATVFVFRDSGWVVQPSATQRNLHGVFFQADGQSGWAVGDAGAIIHTGNAGAQWSSQASRTSYNLNGVWFTSADEGWAVGNFGTLMHTTDAGANWNRVAVNASENLTDVCFTDPDTGFACGSAGVVLNTVDGGASWGRTTLTTFTLRSVSFAGARFGWVVGDGGALFGTIDRGVSWADDGAGTTQALKAVWRRRAESAWAVGSQGVAPLTTGTPTSFGWSLVNTGAFNQLEGVHLPSDLTA